MAAIYTTAEARVARHRGQHAEAERQQALADSYQAMHDAYGERETVLAAVMADRGRLGRRTRHQCHLGLAADAELRRCHSGLQLPTPALHRTLPHPRARRDEFILTTGEQIAETGRWIKDLAAQRRAFADQ